MANFHGHQLTADGQNLQAKLYARSLPLVYTHVKMGDGILGSTLVKELHDVISLKLLLNISGTPRRNDIGRWDVSAVYNNSMVSAGFYFREWALFARDPDTNAEIMIQYANSGDTAEYITPFDGNDQTSYIEEQLTCSCIVSSEITVTAEISQSQLYVTEEEFNLHVNDSGIHMLKSAYDPNNMGCDMYAAKISVSLPAASWGGTASPYTQVVAVSGGTANSKIDLQLTPEQYAALMEAGVLYLQVINNQDGSFTAHCLGEKPPADLTIQATRTEVTSA